MAALELSSSEDSFMSLAVSTSALDMMIWASLSLFCLAAAVRFCIISGGSIMSVRYSCSMRMPLLLSCCCRQSLVELRNVTRFFRMLSRVDPPTTVLMAAWAASRMAAKTLPVPRVYLTLRGLVVRKYTEASTASVILSMVITVCLPRCSVFSLISTSMTSSEQGLMMLKPGVSILVNLPNCSTIPATQASCLPFEVGRLQENLQHLVHMKHVITLQHAINPIQHFPQHTHRFSQQPSWQVALRQVGGKFDSGSVISSTWKSFPYICLSDLSDRLISSYCISLIKSLLQSFMKLNTIDLEDIEPVNQAKEQQAEAEEERPASAGTLMISKINPKTALVSRTDEVFTFVLISVEIALAFIMFYSLGMSMPHKLGMGFDFRGLICGEAPLQNKPYLYKILPQTDLNLQICVSECPKLTGPQICLYQPDGVTQTTFCYQVAETIPQGYYCVQKEYISQRTIRSFLTESIFVVQRFLQNIVENLRYFGIAMATTVILVIFVKFLTPVLEIFILRPLIFLSQVVILGFAYLSYQAYQHEVQEKCINSVQKYDCASGKFKGLFILYLCLGFAYIIRAAKDWNKVRMGCINISKSDQLHSMVNKLGLGVYLSPIGLGWLFAFGLFTLNNTVTLFIKSLTAGQIHGGFLYALTRRPESATLLACAVFSMFIITATYLSLCQVSIIMAVSKWSIQPNKQHSFLFDGFMTTIRYRLGSVCLHAVLKCAVMFLYIPMIITSYILNIGWIRTKCRCLQKCFTFFEGVMSAVAVDNFVFAPMINANYFELAIYRKQLKRAKYNRIMEAQTVTDTAILHISLALGLVCSAISYIIAYAQGVNSEFLLMLPLVYTPVTSLFVYTALMRYDLTHRALMLLGICRSDSTLAKYCEDTLEGQVVKSTIQENDEKQLPFPTA